MAAEGRPHRLCQRQGHQTGPVAIRGPLHRGGVAGDKESGQVERHDHQPFPDRSRRGKAHKTCPLRPRHPAGVHRRGRGPRRLRPGAVDSTPLPAGRADEERSEDRRRQRIRRHGQFTQRPVRHAGAHQGRTLPVRHDGQETGELESRPWAGARPRGPVFAEHGGGGRARHGRGPVRSRRRAARRQRHDHGVDRTCGHRQDHHHARCEADLRPARRTGQGHRHGHQRESGRRTWGKPADPDQHRG